MATVKRKDGTDAVGQLPLDERIENSRGQFSVQGDRLKAEPRKTQEEWTAEYMEKYS